MTDEVQAPSTSALVAALATGLLPLAGPYGIAVSALVPAVQQLYDVLMAHEGENFSVGDLAKIVLVDNEDALAALKAHVAAMPDDPKA